MLDRYGNLLNAYDLANHRPGINKNYDNGYAQVVEDYDEKHDKYWALRMLDQGKKVRRKDYPKDHHLYRGSQDDIFHSHGTDPGFIFLDATEPSIIWELYNEPMG